MIHSDIIQHVRGWIEISESFLTNIFELFSSWCVDWSQWSVAHRCVSWHRQPLHHILQCPQCTSRLRTLYSLQVIIKNGAVACLLCPASQSTAVSQPVGLTQRAVAWSCVACLLCPASQSTGRSYAACCCMELWCVCCVPMSPASQSTVLIMTTKPTNKTKTVLDWQKTYKNIITKT